MILFFDTETTGRPDFRRPVDDTFQPQIVQLAALLTEDDGTERASFSIVVLPSCTIPSGAAAVHGITDQIADRCGVSPKLALMLWDDLAGRAETIVAHNIRFDWFLMASAWSRTSARAFDATHGQRARFCTMDAASPIVNLPPTERMIAAGFNKPKPPKLEECIRHFFGEDLIGAHDALADVRACARVFFHLRSLEKVA